MLCVLLLGLLAEPLAGNAAAAPERRFTFAIPAAAAPAALAAFTAITGIAVGWDEGLPTVRLRALNGSMPAQAALRALLAGSGYRAEQVGPTAFRIVRARSRGPADRHGIFSPRRRMVVAALTTTPSGEILVTGQKRPQALQDVPMSVAVVDMAGPRADGLSPGTRDIVASVDGLAITNLGPGRDRQFIRGVADSPFNGPSQATVAVQLDEARVTFDAPDPDIRLVDMERIEILKGPQGPLYGSGALGGIYHLVTRKPDLAEIDATVRLGAEAVGHGGLGTGLDAVVNLPLGSPRLAVRAVGYAAREAGWIDNQGGKQDANITKVAGGRLGVRWQAAPDWTVDVSGMLQDVNTADSQYVTRSHRLVRPPPAFAEPSDNDFKSTSATIRGRLGDLDVLGTASYVQHQVDSVLDATDAAPAFGLAGPSRYDDDRRYDIYNDEVRLVSTHGIRWLAGLSYMTAQSRSSGVITGSAGSLTAEHRNRSTREVAGFGEVTLPLSGGIKATAGARLFHSRSDDEAAERAGATADHSGRTIVSPSLALSVEPMAHAFVYLRYARAIRPGGLVLASEAQSRRFDSDALGTLDLGMRYDDRDAPIALSASVFRTDWTHIQSDYLLSDGLIATRNAGRGLIYGVEANAVWRPRADLLFTLGTAYIDARLVRNDTGIELDDRRLPVTPDLTVRALSQYRHQIAGWEATVGAQVNYVGRSRLSFDSSLDRRMGDYATVALSAVASHMRTSVSARIDNLLDGKSDSFAFGNPFSIMTQPQYTPIRPRTLSIAVTRRW